MALFLTLLISAITVIGLWWLFFSGRSADLDTLTELEQRRNRSTRPH